MRVGPLCDGPAVSDSGRQSMFPDTWPGHRVDLQELKLANTQAELFLRLWLAARRDQQHASSPKISLLHRWAVHGAKPVAVKGICSFLGSVAS